VRALDIPLTVNAVCHRHNYDRLEDMIDLAVKLGARRLEVATVQFHGWAQANRNQLIPTIEQAKFASETILSAREKLKGVLVIDYVPADYHATFPKACMGGWGQTGLNIDPIGRVLPCHTAETIRGLEFDYITDKTLAEIWFDGSAFNTFRGFDWMQEPCRSCERREMDFGGCRCQAMAFANDAAATDPVCSRSPLHAKIKEITQSALTSPEAPFVYRTW
jgi:PqqA peptide cyclase